jgi:sterol desaturase/sphingolipid hydroxylase (fatty acid hydroxylase superfamily)
VQIQEAADDVIGTRTMYGWRPPQIAPRAASKRTLVAQKQILTPFMIIAASLVCTAAFLVSLVVIAHSGLSASTSLIVGFVVTIICYETWILVQRFLRHRERSR